MDGGAWWATVHGVVKSQTRLSDFTFTSHSDGEALLSESFISIMCISMICDHVCVRVHMCVYIKM